MAIKIIEFLAAPALSGAVLLAPLEANSQQGLQIPSLPDPGGILSLQQVTPPETLNLLQVPTQLSPTTDSQGGALGGSINPVVLESLVGGVDVSSFPQPTDQSHGPRRNNPVVWSDNRGVWKSNPPGDACMLLSSTQINSDSCN